jgi:hypothetical protein
MLPLLVAALPTALAAWAAVYPRSPWVELQGEWSHDQVPLSVSDSADNTIYRISPLQAMGGGSMSFAAQGSAVEWRVDTVLNATYTPYVDGAEVPAEAVPGEPWMVGVRAPHGWHNWTLAVSPQGAIYQATVFDLDWDAGFGGASPDPAAVEVLRFSHDQTFFPDNVSFTAEYTGRWVSEVRYSNFTTTSEAGASVTLHLPRGSRYSQVVGRTTATLAGYTVSISPDPALGPAQRTYPARGYTLDTNVPLLVVALEPREAYAITITHSGGAGEIGWMDLVVYWWVPRLAGLTAGRRGIRIRRNAPPPGSRLSCPPSSYPSLGALGRWVRSFGGAGGRRRGRCVSQSFRRLARRPVWRRRVLSRDAEGRTRWRVAQCIMLLCRSRHDEPHSTACNMLWLAYPWRTANCINCCGSTTNVRWGLVMSCHNQAPPLDVQREHDAISNGRPRSCDHQLAPTSRI